MCAWIVCGLAWLCVLAIVLNLGRILDSPVLRRWQAERDA